MKSSGIHENDSPSFEDSKNLWCENYYEEVLHGQKTWYCCTFPGCSKAFRYKSEIKRHSVIHSDNRPYHCSFKECNKAFKRIDALECHLLSHSAGIKPLECGFSGCNYKSRSQNSLYFHTLKHENQKDSIGEITDFRKSSKKFTFDRDQNNPDSHMIIYAPKKEEFDEPTKLIKREPSVYENSERIQKIKSEFYESEATIIKSDDSFHNNFCFEGSQKQNLVQMLWQENQILTRALAIHTDFLKQKMHSLKLENTQNFI